MADEASVILDKRSGGSIVQPPPIGPVGKSQRSNSVDRIKGVAIVLVVWGHISGGSTPLTPRWYNISISVVYAFHMPLFMYLSGYVFFLGGFQDRFWTSPITYLRSRIDRLVIPFFGFSVLVVVGKYAAERFGPVDDRVTNIWLGMYDAFTNAPDNPCVAIWYLLTLFVYSLAMPFLWRLSGRNLLAAALVAVMGWFIILPERFYLQRFGMYFVFFVAGGFVALHSTSIVPLFKRYWIAAMVIFVLAISFTLGSPLALLICGLLSIPAIHGLMLQSVWERDRIFVRIGLYSLAIYLLNTIALGVFKLAYLPHLEYEGRYFPPYFIAALSFGTGAPLLVAWFIETIPVLKFFKRYIR